MRIHIFILFLLSVFPGVPLAWWGLMFVIMGALAPGLLCLGIAAIIWGALACSVYYAY